MPLRQVLSWERGGKMEPVLESTKRPQTLVITLDSAGVCKIERVSHRPSSWGGSRGRFAFIVEEEESLCDVIMQQKDGRLRLRLPLPHGNSQSGAPRLPRAAYPSASQIARRLLTVS
ncbi:hypothetical protein V8F33_007924 [Rhypophila sp. PSN 637]